MAALTESIDNKVDALLSHQSSTRCKNFSVSSVPCGWSCDRHRTKTQALQIPQNRYCFFLTIFKSFFIFHFFRIWFICLEMWWMSKKIAQANSEISWTKWCRNVVLGSVLLNFLTNYLFMYYHYSVDYPYVSCSAKTIIHRVSTFILVLFLFFS